MGEVHTAWNKKQTTAVEKAVGKLSWNVSANGPKPLQFHDDEPGAVNINVFTFITKSSFRTPFKKNHAFRNISGRGGGGGEHLFHLYRH
jgi:hypothetical protein